MRLAALLLAGVCLLPQTAHAASPIAGVWVEGAVAEVEQRGHKIRVVLTGRCWMEQQRQAERSVIELEAKAVPVTVRLGNSGTFQAMTPDWKRGTPQESRAALLSILRSAADRRRIIRMELAEANVAFTAQNTLASVQAAVARITDYSQR